MPGCYKGNVTGLKCLSCDNGWLICDVCLSNGCQTYKECDLCPVKDVEVVIDWFIAMIWGTVKISSSLIGSASEFLCKLGSVARQVCYAWAFFQIGVEHFGGERVLSGHLRGSAWNSFPESKGFLKDATVSSFI